MPIRYVTGDPLLTSADTLAIDHNARGRTELSPLHTRLMQQYPTAFSAYTRQAKQGKHPAGDYFLWRDSTPRLLFLTVRESSVGATRLRYIQQIFLQLARDYTRYAITQLAIAPLGNAYIQNDIRRLCDNSIGQHEALSVVLYSTYERGIRADEPFDNA